MRIRLFSGRVVVNRNFLRSLLAIFWLLGAGYFSNAQADVRMPAISCLEWTTSKTVHIVYP